MPTSGSTKERLFFFQITSAASFLKRKTASLNIFVHQEIRQPSKINLFCEIVVDPIVVDTYIETKDFDKIINKKGIGRKLSRIFREIIRRKFKITQCL